MEVTSPATEVSATDERGSEALAHRQAQGLLEKILPFAQTADAVARRTVGKARTLAVLGLISATWITIASVQTFAWGIGAALAILLPLLIPAAVLWKIHGVLDATLGLPQRILDAADRLFGKAKEIRRLYHNRDQTVELAQSRSRFKDLWRSGRSLLEIKALSDEARELISLAGGAMLLIHPLFAIALFGASAAALLIIIVAVIIGIAVVF